MIINIIRHGETKGNAEKRYVGRTDESLSPEGIKKLNESLKYPGVKKVYVSPLKRARETASLLFPYGEQIVIHELREMDFGDFENKGYEELCRDEEYIRWIESDCELPCPNGENKREFTARCIKGFEAILQREKDHDSRELNIVAHGGTIMAICSELVNPGKEYYKWYVKNGEKVSFEFCNEKNQFYLIEGEY